MRVRTLAVGLLTGLVLLSSSVTAGRRIIKLGSIIGRVDINALVPLLQKGELSLVESFRSGRLKQVAVIGLVNAAPDKVWRVLTDYGRYMEFMPNLAEIEVVKREGDDIVLEYELEVPGSNIEYTLRHHHVPKSRIDITLVGDEGDITSGAWRWELVPTAGGAKTILIYTLYTDVRETSWIIRQVLKSQPSMEHGLNVATGLITVQTVKKRAEKL